MSGAGRRHAQRHLFAGRAALRAADRHDAVRRGAAAARPATTRCGGSSAKRSRPGRARGSARWTASVARRSPSTGGPIPRGLTQLVRGELDWIVMKALEKDRTRRYETANAFAADIAAVSGRRAGRGVPAVGCLPAAQVRPAEQGVAGDRGGSGPDADLGHRREFGAGDSGQAGGELGGSTSRGGIKSARG